MGRVVPAGDRISDRCGVLGAAGLLSDSRPCCSGGGGVLPGHADRAPAPEIVNHVGVLQGHAQILGATGGADRQ